MADPVLTQSVNAFRFKESQPKQFNSTAVAQMAKGAQYAVTNLGVPAIAIDSLPQRMLQEGREDAGANNFNYNNPAAVKVYDQMQAAGFNKTVSTYAAAVLDKSQTATKLGIPFDSAWNGTGRSADSGKTGTDYANQMLAQQSVTNDPRNAQFVSFIQRAATGGLTPKENLSQATSASVIGKTYGSMDSSTDLLGNGDPGDNFSFAIQSALTKAGVTDQSIDGIRSALGPGANYESSIADHLLTAVKQKAGIPLSTADKNNAANVPANSVLSNILDQLSTPIANQYK